MKKENPNAPLIRLLSKTWASYDKDDIKKSFRKCFPRISERQRKMKEKIINKLVIDKIRKSYKSLARTPRTKKENKLLMKY